MDEGYRKLGQDNIRRREGEGTKEDSSSFLSGLVGRPVLVKQLTAPDLDAEFAEKVLKEPLTIRTSELQARTAVMVLKSYDHLGIVLRPIQRNPISAFIPWSALIELSNMEPEEEEESAGE